MSERTTKITTILKLFSSLFKRNSANKEQTPNAIHTEIYETDSETSIEERPMISEKNKWLYPTDNFGTMEHGVVDSEKRGKKKKKRIIFLE